MLRPCVEFVGPSKYLQLRMVPTVCMLVLFSAMGQIGCIPQSPPTPSPYGDGSAGDVTVAANTFLFDLVPSGNTQFRDFTVNNGITLSVHSGTIIRCSGTFTNNGTIKVIVIENESFSIHQSASTGISNSAAGNGETVLLGTARAGVPGAGLYVGEAMALLAPDPRGGGGGGSADKFPDGAGGSGGGALTVLAKTAIVNAGTINANANPGLSIGGGGGGGGVIILASSGSITNSGLITARGGQGANGSITLTDSFAGGGGGGGGLVHLLSPVITATPITIDVAAGAIGTLAGGVAVGAVHSGGGGGGSGGQGGLGGPATLGPGGVSTVPPQPGAAGQTFQTLVDPTDLF